MGIAVRTPLLIIQSTVVCQLHERDNTCNTQGLITISTPAISLMLCDQLRHLLCYLLSSPPLWHCEITCAPFLKQARSAALLAQRKDALGAHTHDSDAGLTSKAPRTSANSSAPREMSACCCTNNLLRARSARNARSAAAAAD